MTVDHRVESLQYLQSGEFPACLTVDLPQPESALQGVLHVEEALLGFGEVFGEVGVEEAEVECPDVAAVGRQLQRFLKPLLCFI